MGRFILCTGVSANIPYQFQLTDTKVYSLEELGYYLYHNIDTVSMDTFSSEFFKWVRYDLNREDLAERWEDILKKSLDIKDIVISILCSTDYFTKQELESLIKTVDMLNGLSAIKKQKMRADNYLKYYDYENATKEYEEIISADESDEFDAKSFGNILHNLAIAHIQQKFYEKAEIELKRAYSLNKSEETIKEYFLLLKLQRKEKVFMQEVLNYNISQEKVQEYLDCLEELYSEAEKSREYKKIVELPKLKEKGKIGDYYYQIDSMIFEWKQNYKRGMEQS